MKKILLCSSLISIYLILGGLTWGNHIWLLCLTLISNFILSFFTYTKNKTYGKIEIGLLINLPFILILTLTCLFYNDFSRGFMYIIFMPLSTYLAYLFSVKKNILIPFFSFSFFFIISFFLFPNFFAFYKNNNSNKNDKLPQITLIDKYNKKINLHRNKIIVLDFWSTSCGICFKKFPDLEDTYLKYKNNLNIEIYAVHVPTRDDKFDLTIKILDSIGYKFPKLYSKSAKEIKDSLNIYSFPHLLIIKNGKIRFEGMLETKKTVIIYNIEDKLDKLLTED